MLDVYIHIHTHIYTLIIIMVNALHVLFESSRYEYSFIFLYMSAWQHLAKIFLLREHIKAASKQACYCSTAWVPASKKQIDDYLAAAVKENCEFSEFFFPGGVDFNLKVNRRYRWQSCSS